MPEPTDGVAIKVTEPVQKGSIVLVDDMIDPEEMPRLITSLRHIAGHEKFLIVHVPEGSAMSVHTPDDLKRAVRALVREEFDNMLKELRARE